MPRLSLPLCLILMISTALHAQIPAADSNAIRTVMQRQQADWNRGDLDAFATGYKNSPDILFLGRTMHKGYAAMVAGYHQSYPTPEKMGKLSFSQVEIQPLDAKFATVTGKYHLERAKTAGGDADGYYMLVFEKTAAGWKIVRDDSTAAPKDDGK